MNALAMKKAVPILLLVFSISLWARAQDIRYKVLPARVIDGDTMPYVTLHEVEVYSLRIPRSRKAKKRLSKYVRNIKKVYPYAKLAGIKLSEYNEMLVNASTDRERKRIMKQAEEEINEQYGGELRDLTFTQGKILIKLIDRETGESSYNLVQDLRGNFTAFWYQAFARIWGYNLKVKYDPKSEDRKLEIIVRMIERGQL